ncbi:MAG: DNA polymerase III subunit alpha [Candidatus Taylorbacteria bacterium]|nr:DNA polymerase III subunit alpha [Candidatus Taylorbacteria bacterium]
MKNFIHLHTHSHYSLLNALPQIKDLVKEVKNLGMSAVALTDAGNMYGAIDFYQACKKNEIKPIIGVDFYVASRTRNDKQGGVDNRRTRLVLLAKNDIGYKNLIKLVTDSYFEGFYYKPRIDKELIERYKEGLVCIMPHFSGETSYALKITDNEKAKSLMDWYKKIYGKENFYLEITHHPEIEGQIELKEKIIKIAKETDTNLVAGHDVYYLHPEDKAARDTLVQVNSHSDFGDREQRESNDDFSLISTEKALEYFKDTPEAIENTEKIADMCNLEITLGKWIFPNYIVPSGLSHDDELRRIAYEGMREKGLGDSKIAIDRLEYELKVIRDKGYSQYFLVVYDLLRFARENGIYTNIRGSVAGSLTTYVTGITKVDPIEYKLPFERFLNPERPSAPDIDMDFADDRRDEVIEYTRQKYGKDNVAQIGTFGTMMARGSCRDVARAMGYPLPLADKIAKLVPMGAQGKPMTLKKAMEDVPELKQMYDSDKDTKTIIDMAQKIEGCARHISVHAAGVVVAPDALTNYVPLQYDPKGEGKIITQYDMYDVGEDGIGLLKFDFLGIKNLSILADAVNRVKIIEKFDIDIEKIPLDDKKTFEMLARGETIGLFQLNGSGMTKYLKDLKPTVIHDINAMVALYRPGPIESIPEYIDRKHHPEKIKYMDPRMKEYLDQSYGVITYQDDVMLTAIKLAGYSWLEADKLRKAMGKKIPEEMQKQKDKLLKGFVAGGITEKKAETLWKLIEPFAAYGFNKCLVGDTKIADIKSKNILTIKEIYEKNLKPVISTMNDSFILESKPITMVMENGIKEVFELKTINNKKIKATDNHPFYTKHGWKDINNLKPYEEIAVISKNDNNIHWEEISSIKKSGKEMTYDITLPPYHNFVANDIIVHNSHAASYGRVAYQTAYMKANFPAIYMSAVLTADQGDVEKIGEFITECNRIKIPVLPPSINESFSPFSVVKTPGEPDKIRFGLTSIKNFGEGISKIITADRKKNGKFKSLSDFLERIIDRNLNKKSLEALVKTGALDEFGERGQLLANTENLLKYNKEFSTKNKDQDSLFGVFDSNSKNTSHGDVYLEKAEPATQSQKLLWEKDLLGLYISGHPLDKYRAVLEKQPVNIKKIKEPEEVVDPELSKIKGVKTIKDFVNEGKPVGGIIEEVREIMTKNNDPMAFIKIADFTGSIEAVVFPKTYAQYRSSIVVDKCIVAVCKVSERNGEISLIIERLKELN